MVKCDLKSCIYNESGKCGLENIKLNDMGICLDCRLPGDKILRARRRQMMTKPLFLSEED